MVEPDIFFAGNDIVIHDHRHKGLLGPGMDREGIGGCLIILGQLGHDFGQQLTGLSNLVVGCIDTLNSRNTADHGNSPGQG